MRKIRFLIYGILVAFFFAGCFLETEDECEQKEWNVLVYMAADNNLEGAGISDFNEIESSGFDESRMNVFVLFDRAEGNDASNGDWTDTRLYKAVKDSTPAIASLRLDCRNLGLSSEENVELDMANKETVSGFISYILQNYPAKKNAFIVWGHGSGWRYYSTDSYSLTKLSPVALGQGIKKGLAQGEKFDLICFDTCFSMNIETLWELKECTHFMAGTSGIMRGDGLDYSFLGKIKSASLSAQEFGKVLCDSFSEDNTGYEYECFSLIDLSELEPAVENFNVFARMISQKISDSTLQNDFKNYLSSSVMSYYAPSYPCDLYLDLWELISGGSEWWKNKDAEWTASDEEVFLKAGDALEKLFVYSVRGQSVTTAYPLGIFFAVSISPGIFDISHPSSYVNGSKTADKCSFVNVCTGYVPSVSGDVSLIDRLFYWNAF